MELNIEEAPAELEREEEVRGTVGVRVGGIIATEVVSPRTIDIDHLPRIGRWEDQGVKVVQAG